MLRWFKKFVLDILPSVAATIIGAYIVNHYIIPKAQSGAPQPSIASIVSDVFGSKPVDGSADKSAADKAASDKAVIEKASFEKGVAEKAAIEKTASKAASDKAATGDRTAAIDKTFDGVTEPAIDSRKHHPAPKVATKPPAQDERKASDLARAALERLRGGTADPVKDIAAKDTAAKETAKVELAKTADAPRVMPVSTVASAPPMQPLPPAISVTTPNADVFEQGNAAPVVRQPYPQAASRQESNPNEPRRFTPPADIPTSRPLDLRAEAMSPASDRGSVTDEVVSAAKSMFHAVMPR